MKRSKKIDFRVTLTEYFLIQQKAKEVGLTKSEYIRNTALGYVVSSKLSPDEIEVYKLLNKYADNFRRISNLFKLGDTTGVKTASLETASLIREHLNKLR